MEHKTIKNLNLVISKLNSTERKTKIIAVSKTFEMDSIMPLINHGHADFGENKIQEAVRKWSLIKNDFKHIKLHMIGKLQTNKVKYVVPLFDYIHSLDNIKLAEKISSEQKKNKKFLKIFIQVNIGNEHQKNGIPYDQVESFYKKCVEDLKLDVIGLMCIPPIDGDVKLYFSKVQKLNLFLGLKELSMGMSSDYLEAINYGSTYIRVGSKIFGQRS